MHYILTFLFTQVFLPLVLVAGTPVDPGFPIVMPADCEGQPTLAAYLPDEFYGPESIRICGWEELGDALGYTHPGWFTLDYHVTHLWEDGSIGGSTWVISGSGEDNGKWVDFAYCGAPAMGCTPDLPTYKLAEPAGEAVVDPSPVNIMVANDCTDEPVLSAWSPLSHVSVDTLQVCGWRYLRALTQWGGDAETLDYTPLLLTDDGVLTVQVHLSVVEPSGDNEWDFANKWETVTYCAAPAMGCDMAWGGSMSEGVELP